MEVRHGQIEAAFLQSSKERREHNQAALTFEDLQHLHLPRFQRGCRHDAARLQTPQSGLGAADEPGKVLALVLEKRLHAQPERRELGIDFREPAWKRCLRGSELSKKLF